jgi:ATP-dependent DNA ligase
VRERLAPLHRKTPPLAKPLKRSDTIWVEPTVVADIAFTELTEDGMSRHRWSRTRPPASLALPALRQEKSLIQFD